MVDSNLFSFSEEERRKALDKYNIIKPFLFDGVPLVEITKKSNVSYRTLSRWVHLYRKEQLIGLIDKQRSDKGQTRCVKSELTVFVEGMALQNPQPSIAAIYRKTKEIAIKNGWDNPSYPTVYNIVKNLNPSMVTLATEGGKRYDEKYELLYKRQSKYPNEIWQADHSLLDIWLITSDNKNRRPWLTIILDDYSRSVAGYFLTFDSPNTQNTSLALHQAIWYKSDTNWRICGIPDIFYTDNGSDFTSSHLEQVSADIKLKLVFSIAGKPRGRGIVERFFSTINQLFLCNLPGYMPEGKFPKKAPTLNINDLDILLKKFLIEFYNLNIHSETKQIPQERWQNGDFIPRLPDSLEQLDLLLLTVSKPRKVHPDGIHFQNLKYMDTILASYVGEDIIIRYDPRDMAEIRVFHNNQFICRAINQEIAGETITLKDIIKARNHRKKFLKNEIKNKSEIVDLLLEIHKENVNNSNAKESKSKSKLKRYYNDE